MPCSLCFCPISLTGKCWLQWVTCLVQSLWFLVHHPHWILTRMPLGYPVAAPIPGDLSWIIPQDQLFHQLQQVLYGVDARVGQLKACLCALMVDKLDSLGYWDHHLSQGGGVSSPTSITLGLVHSHLWWGVGAISPECRASSLAVVFSKGKLSFPRAS